jgi:lipopolysaccharide transport system ATP-binding protein
MHGGIAIQGLGKRFRRRNADAPRTTKEWVLRGWRTPLQNNHFWALRDITLSIKPGEMFGVIGHNGAGKSTLLRLLGGVMQPDEGEVASNGQVSGLLALNTGMHEDLSGRENILINGVIAGLSLAEAKERMPDIIRFAELEAFIDSPVRTYSSGMKLRLGFATAAHVEPDILLIDEVLSVGDLAFQQKCLARLDSFRQRGCTIVLITHEHEKVASLCDRAAWLNAGKLALVGEPAMVLDGYRESLHRETLARMAATPAVTTSADAGALEPQVNRFGSLEGAITGVRLLGADGEPLQQIHSGDPLTVELSFEALSFTDAAIVSVAIGNDEHGTCLDLNSEVEGVTLPALDRLGTLRITLDRLDLAPGAYFISVGLFPQDWAHALDYHWRAYPLTVEGQRVAHGSLSPPRSWKLMSPAEMSD